jgi:hypothetical protein
MNGAEHGKKTNGSARVSRPYRRQGTAGRPAPTENYVLSFNTFFSF